MSYKKSFSGILSALLCASAVGGSALAVSLVATPALAATATEAWSNDADYALGDLVSFGSDVYRCIIAHHSSVGWDPANVPALWERVAEEGEVAWHAQTAYTGGDIVEYNGNVYECVIGHTSQPGWTPSAVPALWKLLGAI